MMFYMHVSRITKEDTSNTHFKINSLKLERLASNPFKQMPKWWIMITLKFNLLFVKCKFMHVCSNHHHENNDSSVHHLVKKWEGLTRASRIEAIIIKR